MKQANFLLSEELLEDLRALVPRGEQSRVVGEALSRELKRRKLQKALSESYGAWGRREDLGSTRRHVRKMRRERVH